MPRSGRPATTGYERLAQAEVLSDDSDDDLLSNSHASLHPALAGSSQQQQPRPRSGMTSPRNTTASLNASRRYAPQRPPNRRRGSTSGVDLKAINARLERWADEITARFKRRRGASGRSGDDADDDDRLEIHHSVFQAPEGVRPVTAEGMAAAPPPAMSGHEFDTIVESVRLAIEQNVHPSMISQGSSGSYFARDPDGKVVGVFKPKDEEPYAAGNPKWNKWIHRNLFPCCFGRACLIPNLSYVSEAAAYTLDCQLRTHIVPYTDVVYLSSKSFHYPFWDRRAFRKKKKALPAKPGSFQVFLKGFRDANVFLREHPWPVDQQYWASASALRGGGGGRSGGGRGGGGGSSDSHRPRSSKRWADSCRPSTSASRDDPYSDEEAEHLAEPAPPGPGNFVWTETVKQSFREQLEKLVILDYIMRNTDRGLDNWMIKVDWQTEQVTVASEPMRMNPETADEAERGPRPVELSGSDTPGRQSTPLPYRVQRPMRASTPPSAAGRDPKITVGAIDNSLSWPWKHPDAWRSFPFGWLFLPVDLIGHPFSQKTRDHFLPLLTSTAWWSETQLALRRVFTKDSDFQERMFARQMAVMKGQAWNVVETLKMADHGPLELTRRAKVCVWDDLVDVPIAVPMRVSSPDARLYASPPDRPQSIDEVDIGASSSAAAATSAASKILLPADEDDLLGTASPPADMPSPGRFVRPTTTTTAHAEPIPSSEDHTAALSNGADPLGTSAPAKVGTSSSPSPPLSSSHRPPARSALSHQQQQHHHQHPLRPPQNRQNQQRRGSFARSIAQQLYGSSGSGGGGGFEYYNPELDGDEFDGDLGYAAAQDMEGNHRKVIVERLEAVKTRNPVFTCW